MTKAEWLACTDPTPMLEFLRDKASGRKLRLFACACVRRVWDLIPDERSREAVLVAERFAESLAGKDELARAKAEAGRAARKFRAYVDAGFSNDSLRIPLCREALPSLLAKACVEAARQRPGDAAYACHSAASAVGMRAIEAAGLRPSDPKAKEADRAARDAERALQCMLLRDLAGPGLYGTVPAIDATWLAWCDKTVARVARYVYEEHAFDCLPILADALEEAGCADEEILSHLRGPRLHVRGCWTVDLLLGKE